MPDRASYLIPLSMLVLLFLVTSAVSPCTAKEKLLRIGAPPGGWPPFIIYEKESADRGIMGDIITAIGEKTGFKVEFLILPEKRLQLYLKDGTIDAYPKAMEWVPDPALYRWSDPVIDVTDVVIIRKTNSRSRVPATLLGLNVGAVHGYSYPKLQDSFDDGSIRRHDAMNTENLLSMLDHGHVDAILTNPIVANWIIRNCTTLQRDRFLYSATPLDSASYRFAFTKGWNSQPFIDVFNAELRAMKRDGRLQAIVNKYQ